MKEKKTQMRQEENERSALRAYIIYLRYCQTQTLIKSTDMTQMEMDDRMQEKKEQHAR